MIFLILLSASTNNLYQRRFEMRHAKSVPDSNISGNLVENSNVRPFELFNGVNKSIILYHFASREKKVGIVF